MAQAVRDANPGKVPILISLHESPGSFSALPKKKYLVEGEAEGGKLRGAIRMDARVPATTPLHLYLSDADELDYDTMLARIDAKHRNDDGFLYVSVSSLSPAELASQKKSVPYLQDLLARVNPEDAPNSAPGFASPHGERTPAGADISSCTFLNPRSSGKLLPTLSCPSNNGRVPPSLYLAVLLDVTAVGLVVPLLAAYSRALGAGPRFTGLLQASAIRMRMNGYMRAVALVARVALVASRLARVASRLAPRA